MIKIMLAALTASLLFASAASAQKYPERCSGIEDLGGGFPASLHGESLVKTSLPVQRH